MKTNAKEIETTITIDTSKMDSKINLPKLTIEGEKLKIIILGANFGSVLVDTVRNIVTKNLEYKIQEIDEYTQSAESMLNSITALGELKSINNTSKKIGFKNQRPKWLK